jgi:hypothetical protein
MVVSPAGLGPDIDSADERQQQMYKTDPPVREGASHQQTRNCLTVIKCSLGPQMGA